MSSKRGKGENEFKDEDLQMDDEEDFLSEIDLDED